MIQCLIAGISQALHKQFGDKYATYAEDVEQNLQQPCFFIQLVTASERRHLFDHFLRSQTIAITFLSQDCGQMELYSISEQMDACLEIISVDGENIRGKDQHSEISEGLLVYTVNFEFRIIKPMRPEEKMEQLKIRRS